MKREAAGRKRPLRVCHVITNTEFGGTQKMLYQLIRQLRASTTEEDLQLSVVSLLRCGEIGDDIVNLGVPVFAMQFTEGGWPRPHRMLRLMRQLRSLQPDVVQTWAYHADLVGGLAAKLATTADVVWNIRHGTLDPKVDSKNTLRSAKLCARLSRRVPKKILLNAHSAVPVHARAGYQADKLRVIPNGFDTDRFRPRPSAKQQLCEELGVPATCQLVGMCGRLHPHKGQSEFLAAAGKLVQRRPDAHFVIAGHLCTPDSSTLRDWIAEQKLAGRVHLLGSRRDVPEIMSALDVYVLPSLTEGMPNVVGEAMAAGTCVVATDVGDAGALLGGLGTVVPPGDVTSLASAIDDLLARESSDRAQLGLTLRKRVEENYSIQVVSQRFLDLWRDVAARNARPRIVNIADFEQDSTLHGDSPGRDEGTHEVGGARTKLVHVSTIPMTPWLFLGGQNQAMTEAGYDVHCISAEGPFRGPLIQRDPITSHVVPMTRTVTPLRDLTALVKLYRLLRRLRPEIVQLSTPKAAFLGALAARIAGVPVRVFQVRGLTSESRRGVKRKLYQCAERLTDRLCTATLVNAPSLLEYAIGAGITKYGRVLNHGTSNGIDAVKFDPEQVVAADLTHWRADWEPGQGRAGDEVLTLGYVGRLTRDKGIEELWQAWRVLRDEFPLLRMLLVGPWEPVDSVSGECRQSLESDERVLCVGTQLQVAPFMKWIDVLAFPSHGTEGFPNAPMEAAAMGIPVVATHVIGCVDAIIDGVTGALVSPKSTPELTAALREYLEDGEKRRRHALAGQIRVRKRFVPSDLWATYRVYYAEQLDRAGLPTPDMPDKTAAKAA